MSGSARKVVVGVDGSGPSREALRWGAQQAALIGARLQAVMAWSVPVMAYGSPVVVPVDLNLAESTMEVLRQVVAEELGEDPPVEVLCSAEEGRPAERLLHAAEGAELLVVGSRGHGAFAGMLLGSVSEHCVAHARCPVVVVHGAAQPAAAADREKTS